MNYGMLNLGSIVLGLVGWVLPVLHVDQLVKGKRGLGHSAHTLSMGACALALWFQICYNEHLVDIGDWGAIEDTIDAVRKVCPFLLITTLLVNLAVACIESALDKVKNEGAK